MLFPKYERSLFRNTCANSTTSDSLIFLFLLSSCPFLLFFLHNLFVTSIVRVAISLLFVNTRKIVIEYNEWDASLLRSISTSRNSNALGKIMKQGKGKVEWSWGNTECHWSTINIEKLIDYLSSRFSTGSRTVFSCSSSEATTWRIKVRKFEYVYSLLLIRISKPAFPDDARKASKRTVFFRSFNSCKNKVNY